jgi:hypothetical protein
VIDYDANWMERLRHGIAEVTAADSRGLLTYRATGDYLPTEWGIHGEIMPEEPDEAIALSLYTVADAHDTVMGVQFRYRSPSEARMSQVADVLSNVWSHRLGGSIGGVQLVLSEWSSGASLGQDENDRLVRSANFYLTVHRPLAFRI